MMTDLDYGPWEIHPHLTGPTISEEVGDHPEMKIMETMYEGPLTYLKFWNFWVRWDTSAMEATARHFYGFESRSEQVMNLLAAVGGPTEWPRSEEEIWERISNVWNWLGENVQFDKAYATLTDERRWPSIDEFANYYADHHELVWASCFSKAHLFAILLGRLIPRWHVLIALAHHTEGGAPPTASHVYVGVYLTNRWYYLDPILVHSGPLPAFSERKSVGAFRKVDYQHPFEVRPVPRSPLTMTPHLPA